MSEFHDAGVIGPLLDAGSTALSPRKTLGLPDPAALGDVPDGFLSAYADLCDGLRFDGSADVIVAADDLSNAAPLTQRTLGEIQISSALLMALQNPDTDLLMGRAPQRVRTLAEILPQELPQDLPGDVAEMVRMVREYRAFAGSAEWLRLVQGRSDFEPLLGILCHNPPAGPRIPLAALSPDSSEEWSISVHQYNAQWAISFLWGERRGLLPKLVGFASLRDPEKSISLLLSERMAGRVRINAQMDYGRTGFWNHCPLNANYQLLSMVDFDDHGIEFAGWMMAGLDRSILALLEEDYESLLDDALVRDVALLHEEADGLPLREILDIHGLPAGHGMLKKLLEVLRQMRARHDHHDRVRHGMPSRPTPPALDDDEEGAFG